MKFTTNKIIHVYHKLFKNSKHLFFDLFDLLLGLKLLKNWYNMTTMLYTCKLWYYKIFTLVTKFLPIIPSFQSLSFLFSSATSLDFASFHKELSLVGPENMQYEARLLISFVYLIPSEIIIIFLYTIETVWLTKMKQCPFK